MVKCPWCGKEVSAEEYGSHYETCPRRKGVAIATEESVLADLRKRKEQGYPKSSFESLREPEFGVYYDARSLADVLSSLVQKGLVTKEIENGVEAYSLRSKPEEKIWKVKAKEFHWGRDHWEKVMIEPIRGKLLEYKRGEYVIFEAPRRLIEDYIRRRILYDYEILEEHSSDQYPRSPLGWIKFLNGSVHLYISAEYLDTDKDIPIERAKVLFRDYISDLEKAIQMFKEGLHRLGET
jgi:hypothetical protein